ncbi:alpha/beta fold hydrolase [Rhodocaloribacter sp.]
MRKRFVIATALAALALGAAFIRPDIPVDELKPKYAPPPSQFMKLDGMEVHYRDEGEGPALVLLHGTGASLHTWDGWAEALSDSFRVVRLDLPGFGLTGPNPEHDYHIATYVDFLEHFAGRLGLERFSLAGNSLGGHIAWRYALAHPQRVEKLILIDPAGAPDEAPDPFVFKLARMPVTSRLLTVVTPRSLMEKSLREVYADDAKVTPALVDRYYELSLREGNRAAFVARSRTTEPNRFDQIAYVRAPILILWGEQDGWIPVTTARRFTERLPHAVLLTYPDAGHVPMEEIPARTAADARRFLTGRP